VWAIGTMASEALRAAERLASETGLDLTVVNARFVKPLDTELLAAQIRPGSRLMTVEENALAGGFGSAVEETVMALRVPDVAIERLGIPDEFQPHGSQEILRARLDLDVEGIMRRARAFFPKIVAARSRFGAPTPPDAPTSECALQFLCAPGGDAMIHGKRVLVVLPAYNAEKTLERTNSEIPRDVVDDVILVDDASRDGTVELSRRLGLPTLVHARNLGYGGNQKTCYTAALIRDADIVVMIHPDYQYEPRLIPALASLIALDVYDVVLGSRIIGKGARLGGMPRYKYLANRFLTLVQNLLLREKLTEYHTGCRAFSRRILETLPLAADSDDFVFDNQMLAQALFFGFRVGEVSCPTRYLPDSSSINFWRSVRYGAGVLWTSLEYRLARAGVMRPRIFDAAGPRLATELMQRRVL